MKQVTGYRIGDFIEIFDCVDEIGATCDMHVGFKNDGRKMTGFPNHCIPRYTAYLASVGFELVINESQKTTGKIP